MAELGVRLANCRYQEVIHLQMGKRGLQGTVAAPHHTQTPWSPLIFASSPSPGSRHCRRHLVAGLNILSGPSSNAAQTKRAC